MSRILALPALLAWHVYEVAAFRSFTNMDYDFRWTNIKPTPELRYHQCGGGYQCARLELPLDWNATKDSPAWSEKFNMAIIRLPAQVPVTDPRYGGPVLLNPGGPGVSGTYDALVSGEQLQTVLDAAYSHGSRTYVSSHPSARYFDIVGFDPRGIGNSTPWYSCMHDPLLFNDFMMGINGLYLDWEEQRNSDFNRLWAASIAFPNHCIWDPVTNPSGSKIANFSGTSYVARDLVEFVERHGEWRQKHTTASTDVATRDRLKWRKGEEPILYYGESYGTILGATLAAMQPHRVHRFLLDGVAQAAQYYAGILTSDSQGGDPSMEHFFSLCAIAGPDNCAFYAGPSANDTRARLQHILDDVRNDPIAVLGGDISGPDIIEIGDIQLILSYLFEGPLASWPVVAEILAPLTFRDGSYAAAAKQAAVDVDWTSLRIFDEMDPSTHYPFSAGEASQFFLLIWLWVIEGGETLARYTKAEFVEKIWSPLHNTTSWFGDYDATIYQFFSTWPIKYGWVFGWDHPIASNVTKNPILFASNAVDAETSLQSAMNMTSAFKGSGLIVMEGEGHLATAEPSLCHAKRLRHYFQTGLLPDMSTRCLPYLRPFGGNDMPGTEKFGKLNKEDRILLEAAINYTDEPDD